jgi:DNA-binding MarR family transcriptional regulator
MLYASSMGRQDATRRRDRQTRRASTAIGSVLYGLATRAVRRAPRDLTVTSAATLATLDRTGPRRITDLAAIEGVTQPAMTVLVRVMEESGLVERRGDPSDKRVTLVWLTEAGASYVRARRQAGVQAFARLIDKLTDDEVEALMAALPALQHLAALDSQDREGEKR